MKYTMLIYPKAEEFAGRTEQELQALSAEYSALRDDPACLDGAHLQPAEMTTTVRGVGGERLITDGPFADAKEVLAGYYVIEVPDLDAALEFAHRIPAVRFGGAIEVRPVVEAPVEAGH